MYFATFKNIGETDIAAFATEQERNDWVNFRDPCYIRKMNLMPDRNGMR